eukprot:11204792-Lingulodinium_polyedra.AAC.1
MDRFIFAGRARPEVVIAANERSVREVLGTSAGDAWSMRCHVERRAPPAARDSLTLRRAVAIQAA